MRGLFPQGLPLVPAHGDLTDANVLVAGERVAVIDWGESRREVLPGYDLANLLCSLAVSRRGVGRRAPFEAAFHEGFLSDSDLAASFRAAWRRYSEALALPPEAAFHLFLLAWVALANDKLRYLEDAPDYPDRDSFFAQPQRDCPITFFADRRCLNVELTARHRDQFTL